jgi:hypothetical protein
MHTSLTRIDFIAASRLRDLYLSNGVSVVFIPHNWPTQRDDEGTLTVIGWAASETIPNSADIEILWFSNDSLYADGYTREVDLCAAQQIHPALFAHLAAVDRGVIE